MFSKSILSIGSFTAFMALAASAAHAQTAVNPILEYNFNDTSNTTTTLSTGSEKDSSSVLNFIQTTSATSQGGQTAPISAVDLHSAGGAGVSGLTTDYAFNNTSVSTMVQGTNPSAARNEPASGTAAPGGPTGLTGSASFTVEGWFKTDGTQVLGGGNNTRLVTDASNASTSNNQGFYLSGTSGGTLQFSIAASGGTQQLLNSTAGAFASDKGTWTFFAATYDSTSASGNNTFLYRGTSAGTLASIGASRISVGALAANPDTFGLGSIVANSSATDSTAFLQRTFDGLFDDVRVYGAADNTAALSQSQLQTVLTADLSNTQPIVMTPVVPAPEPSQAAVLGFGVLGLAGLVLRARKRQGVAA